MIDIEKSDRAWIIRLARPEKANALTRSMLEGVRDAARAARGGPNGLILTGAGKVFSAGMDLAEAESGLPVDSIWDEASAAIAAFPGISVAALNGTLAGGAMGMALACDLRVAVPGAKVFYPVISAGFLPQRADPPRLEALIGPARTRRMLLLGERVAAKTAQDWGLIDQVFTETRLIEETMDWIAPFLDAPHGVGVKARLTRPA